MKKTPILAFGLLFLLVGCAQPAATQPAQEPTQVPTQALMDAAMPITDTPEPTATVTSSPFLFHDDFDGGLAAGWNWIGEDPTHWNLTEAPGALRIILQPSNMNDGEPKNFLVREAPSGDFEIATLVHFAPTSNFQFAGLLIYQSQGNAMQFGRAFAKCPFETACKGNAIYFDIIEGGTGGKPNFATVMKNESQAYLRLRREGTTYSGYYSEDGTEWILVGTHESSITPQFVGLIAAQAYESETTADFDYFTIEALP
jgi:cytochrome c